MGEGTLQRTEAVQKMTGEDSSLLELAYLFPFGGKVCLLE